MQIDLERDKRGFYFMDVGNDEKGRPYFRLWVHKRLVRHDYGMASYVEFPLANARVERTKYGLRVLRPSKGWTTFWVCLPGGILGERFGVKWLYPCDAERRVLEFEIREGEGMERGRVGALVSVLGDRMVYRWWRQAEVVSQEGFRVLYADGRAEELSGSPDDLVAGWELEELLGSPQS